MGNSRVPNPEADPKANFLRVWTKNLKKRKRKGRGKREKKEEKKGRRKRGERIEAENISVHC